MKTKIIFTTLLSLLLLLNSCSKEEELSPDTSLNSEITPSQLGDDKNGRFTDKDCTQNNIGCAAEYTVEGIKLNKLFEFSNNPTGSSIYFGANETYFATIIEADVLDMLIDGSAYLHLLVTTNGVNYFAVTLLENNNEIYVLPLK
jgi:hypothetical protein